MSVHSFDDLRGHIGHKIACVCYGDPVVNVAIECETCATVLLDFNQGNEVEVFTEPQVDNSKPLIDGLAAINADVLRKMESSK